MSLPTRERELKRNAKSINVDGTKSLPTRERELKLARGCECRDRGGRSPRGSVN